jgi:transcription factor E2F7/8
MGPDGFPIDNNMSFNSSTSSHGNADDDGDNIKDNKDYSRKDKSLGLLCENFISRYSASFRGATASSGGADSGPVISIDDAAKALGVERRRIYDIINILESICIVSRKCKNTYRWHGKAGIDEEFQKLQKEGVRTWPLEALDNGVIDKSAHDKAAKALDSNKRSDKDDDDEKGDGKEKSLGRLSQKFLQMFLVGNKIISLGEASAKILGLANDDLDIKPNSTLSKENQQAQDKIQKGLKTKVRRLYDIANVMVSLGIIEKVAVVDSRKPSFTWIHANTPRSIWLKSNGNGKALSRSVTNDESSNSSRANDAMSITPAIAEGKRVSFGQNNTAENLEQLNMDAETPISRYAPGNSGGGGNRSTPLAWSSYAV